MYDRGKILAGLVIFVALMTLPFWYGITRGESGAKPNLASPPPGTRCVESREFMRDHHMNLLHQWRDAVVREGKRIYVSSDNREFQMSLTGTCLGCHGKMDGFCKPCHDYVSIRPYCWDCHIEESDQTGETR